MPVAPRARIRFTPSNSHHPPFMLYSIIIDERYLSTYGTPLEACDIVEWFNTVAIPEIERIKS